MEIAPDSIGGGGGYFPFDDTPTFRYEKLKLPFPLIQLRPHILNVEWRCTDGSIYRNNTGGLLAWRRIHEFCEEHFSYWGNGFMHISYHVSPIEGRVEFMRKKDAMLMKLAFV